MSMNMQLLSNLSCGMKKVDLLVFKTLNKILSVSYALVYTIHAPNDRRNARYYTYAVG